MNWFTEGACLREQRIGLVDPADVCVRVTLQAIVLYMHKEYPPTVIFCWQTLPGTDFDFSHYLFT